MGELTARVRLVRMQDGQRLDIPPAFTLTGDEVLLRAEGNRLVVEPLPQPSAGDSLLSVLARLEDLDEDWLEVEDRPPEDVRL